MPRDALLPRLFFGVPLTAAQQACTQHSLDGIVIIGGDDSNTNAAVIAEHFLAKVSSKEH